MVASQDGSADVGGQVFTTLATGGVATTTNPSESALASDPTGTLTATASNGTGTVVGAGRYSGVPTSLTEQLTLKAGSYFDVFLSENNTFEDVEFTDCELNFAREVKWYDALTGHWKKVSDKTLVNSMPPCIRS